LRASALLLVLLFGACDAGGGGEREQKQEFVTQLAALGARVGEILVPAGGNADLDANQGMYGFTVGIEKGATIEICVTVSAGSATVMYYPEFSPGFMFLDAAPGCTDVTNIDAVNDNTALVVVSGTGMASVTTRFL
jgi:hypothetical protein